MWGADWLKDGKWEPVMNDLSHERSKEPTEEMMRWKMHELVRASGGRVGTFKVIRLED